jgi:DNA replication and repair protein RecF
VSLRITSLELTDYRSYERLKLQPDPRITVLAGPNAAGKTNVIEAIQLLTTGVSFRNPLWADLVRWGAPVARATMVAEGDSRRLEVSLDVTEAGRRTFRVNGTVRRKKAEVTGILPSVLFTPDDLRMVKESPDKRRDALDALGRQLSAAYAAILTEYDRALRQRNALLKYEAPDPDAMRAWTQRLVELGSSLSRHRLRLFERLAPYVSGLYGTLSGGEHLSVSYHSSVAGEVAEIPESSDEFNQLFVRRLEEKAAEEVARRSTAVGPHRDDVLFKVDERDARSFASQGQQRTVVLAWKLAEVHVVEDVTGGEPVLLLDDVMSELDEDRRRALAAFVGERVQTIVTTTNTGYFEPAFIKQATVVRVGGGE